MGLLGRPLRRLSVRLSPRASKPGHGGRASCGGVPLALEQASGAVFAQVRSSLAESRRAKLSFDTAWTIALGQLERPRGRQAGYVWADQGAALEETRSAWTAACRRRPASKKDRALAMVMAE